MHTNSFNSRSVLETDSGNVNYYKLERLTEAGLGDISKLPFSIKILIESILRNEDGRLITTEDVARIAAYNPSSPEPVELPFKPARVLMQDFTGVPAIVDLAALRSVLQRMGGDPERINPLIPVDLVIDHSVMVDISASPDALDKNSRIEFQRNRERYEFLRWGQNAFRNFRVIPPSSGICHQINLEYLGKVVQRSVSDGTPVVYPDSLVGTDSHTTMINGLGILGWGVGGIEAEAAMLGQPVYMLPPEVIGFEFTGNPQSGVTATDIVLTVTEILRKKGVVGKFVEFYGSGLSRLSLTDRATIANMAPEYGATMGFFPVDERTLEYLRFTGRSGELIDLIERYTKEQGLFRTDKTPDPIFKDTVELNLATVESSLAGPKRPQDRTELRNLKRNFRTGLTAPFNNQGFNLNEADSYKSADVSYGEGVTGKLNHGSVVIAAITSCTNTSNPTVMIGAGILAKKAVEAGLAVKPHVKTSLAPGSKVVTDYLSKSGLLPYLEQIGFHVVGYGCTTCIGNSGPLPEQIEKTMVDNQMIFASVLSGNRNFTGRVHPNVKASYLASPPLVVAFALAGTVEIDLMTEPIGKGRDGNSVYLKDIWPAAVEIDEYIKYAQSPELFRANYAGIERSNAMWNEIEATDNAVYDWDPDSSYIQEPPFFVDLQQEVTPIQPIIDARVLVKAGDSITTDHISPAGMIHSNSPAGEFLTSSGVESKDYNSYGSRRGNDRVMTRGTFANVQFRNQLGQGKEGGWTTHFPSGQLMTIYNASLKYKEAGVPTIVLGGRDYGMGSSRDWAAKGTFLLGVKAVFARSFERIHRSNLIGMGVLPLQFKEGEDSSTLGIDVQGLFSIQIDDMLEPGQMIKVIVTGDNEETQEFEAVCRIDSKMEIDYYRQGGILQTVLRGFMRDS